MKLITNIPPRLEDTVVATGLARGMKPGAEYTFQRDVETGELVCDVDDDSDAAMFLALPGERFAPFNEADFAKAESLVDQRLRELGKDDDDDEADDDEADPNAPPIEAGTPPAPAKKKAKAKAAPAA